MDVGRYQAKRGAQRRPIEEDISPTNDMDPHNNVSPAYVDSTGGVMLSEVHSRNASESVGNRSSGLLYRPSTATQYHPPSGSSSVPPQSVHTQPPPPQAVSTTTAPPQRGRIPERHHYLQVGDEDTTNQPPSSSSQHRGTGLVFTPIQQRTATTPNHYTTTNTPAATPINHTSAAADRSTFSSMLHTYGATKSHDEELCVILQYLKNYYGQEEDEDVRGLDSMTADDVLALAQCFYLDMFRLLRDKRLERGSPPRSHPHHNASNMSQSNDPYNSFVWGPTPQHVGVPIHEDLDIPPVGEDSTTYERVPAAEVRPPSPRQVAPPSPRQVHPSPRVAEHPRSEYAHPQPTSRTSSTTMRQSEYAPQHEQQPMSSQDHRAYVPPSPSNHTTPASATTPRGSTHRLQTPTSRPMPAPPQSADTQSTSSIRPPPVVRVNPQPQSVVMMLESEEDLPHQRPPSVRADHQNQHIHDARQAHQQQQQQQRSESPFDHHHHEEATTSRPPPRSVALVPLRTAMPLLQRGTYLVKFALHGGKPQRRFMFLKDLSMNLGGGGKKGNVRQVPHLCWSSQPAQAATETLPLLHLLDVRIGSNDNFKKDRKSGRIMAPNSSGVVRESHCFTLIFNTRSVDLAAEQESDFQLWAGGMLAILKRNEELSA